MHTFLYPQKDTYITNKVGYADRNFGIDEILELKAHPTTTTTIVQYSSSSISQSADYSRILIKFDVTEISKSISNGSITSDVTFKLKLKTTQASELPVDYTVYGYPISQSWNMGIGRYSTGGDLVGASWDYTTYANGSGSFWYVSGSTIATGTSASVSQGGTWYNSVPSTYQYKSSSFCTSSISGSSLICSQSYDYTTSDINMDITSIVKGWICGCVPNEGIILVSSLESSTVDGIDSTVKFFSKETNTIYQPYIDISWNDSVYITGSMVPLTGITPYTIVIQNLSKEYKFGSIPRINVFAREKYPLKNFTKGYQQNSYLSSSLLPSASYYCIKDNESENTIIDFDDNTKLSSDGNIHHFKIDTTGLPVERFYKILIKTTFNNQTNIFDNGNIFKITR
jgi:hypothetical protein